MRLIDADKIKQSVTNEMLKAELNSPVHCTLKCVIADIDNQPTAYDVDKVVEQMKENTDFTTGEDGTVIEEYVNLKVAKGIVKSGGIE